MVQGLGNCQTHLDNHDTIEAGIEVENVLVANAEKDIAIRGRTKVVVGTPVATAQLSSQCALI